MLHTQYMFTMTVLVLEIMIMGLILRHQCPAKTKVLEFSGMRTAKGETVND